VRLNKTMLGLISLPLIAIALAVVLLSWGLSSSEKTEANAGTTAMAFRVKAGSADCAVTAKPMKCSVSTATTFDLSVAVNLFPAGGYNAIATDVDWTGTGLVFKKRANTVEVTWPDRGNTIVTNSPIGATRIQHGDISSGGGATLSVFKGNIVSLRFNCTMGASSNVITLVPFNAGTNPGGSGLTDSGGTTSPASASITINCVPAPTSTPVPTATNTPTPTNTPTTVPIPRMQKLPALQNLFLTRQGTKIPPSRCVDSSNFAVLLESIHIPIGGVDPKPPHGPRQIGGFSFQVKYDPGKVCIQLLRGPAWGVNPQQICTIEDSITKPTLQGVARINCVTLGKATLVNTNTAAGRVLAIILVRAQPEAYSQIRANQDNGQVVQLNDEACKLTDLQGHAIEVFSCEDADVTIRFLEGDVEPDCQVNTLDTQAIAFRWGATKGSLIFNNRFNLEPSGTQADQDIDVNDLQFVYGRFGSTCASPWPAQVPQKAK